MSVSRGGLVVLVFVFFAVVSSEFATELEASQTEDLPRYVVFPGLDAEEDEIAEWNVGFASPFNVFFGPKPYILGWVGEAPFGPVPEEGEEDIGDYEEEEVEEGEEEGVEGEGEEELEPDYEYEKL